MRGNARATGGIDGGGGVRVTVPASVPVSSIWLEVMWTFGVPWLSLPLQTHEPDVVYARHCLDAITRASGMDRADVVRRLGNIDHAGFRRVVQEVTA